MMATGLVLVRKVFGVPVPEAEQAYGDDIAVASAEQVIALWNESIGPGGGADAEPTPLWRHRWIFRTKEKRAQRWVYIRGVMMMIGEEEFGAIRLPRIFSPFYNMIRLWNILRKARPDAKSLASRPKN